MKITAINAQKRRADRVSVFLDEEFWTGMSQNLYLQLGLTPGDVLSEERKSEIEVAVVEDKALGWAVERLMARAMSEAKLAEKLREREYGESVIELVLERCRDWGLLNDRNFAESVITSKRERGDGRRKVAEYLRNAGIERELADQLLDEAFTDENEPGLARRALAQRYRGGVLLDRREQRRAQDMLVRRGFSFPAARAAVEERAMDREQEEQAMGVDRARTDLRRRYGSGAEIDRHKAHGFLMRRGYSSEVIRRALEPSVDEEA